MVNAGVGVAWVQTVGPRPADALEADREQGERADADVLETVGVGQFALQQNGTAFFDRWGGGFAEEFIKGLGGGSKALKVRFEG